jgi:hypothetical protein
MKKQIKISDKALKLINQNLIKPIPKWDVVVKNWGLWFGSIISLIILIIGIGITWFGLVDNIIVPYLWIFIAIIFSFFSYLFFEKTKKAYHYKKWQIIIFIITVGLIIGGILFKTGIANSIDKELEKKSTYYRQVVPVKVQTWTNPEAGYLSGTITEIIDDNNFKIKDFDGKTWTVNSQNTLIKGRIQIENGQEIKLLGTQKDNNNFTVEEVRPWGGQNKMKEN